MVSIGPSSSGELLAFSILRERNKRFGSQIPKRIDILQVCDNPMLRCRNNCFRFILVIKRRTIKHADISMPAVISDISSNLSNTLLIIPDCGFRAVKVELGCC